MDIVFLFLTDEDMDSKVAINPWSHGASSLVQVPNSMIPKPMLHNHPGLQSMETVRNMTTNKYIAQV